jgi:hypothetical protein
MDISSINRLTPINTYNYIRDSNPSRSITQNTSGKTQGDILHESISTVYSVAQKYDVKNISPNEMAQMSQELYDNNSISLKNHAFISFQPELNPSYNNTIGKFTHSTSQPDTARNFLDEWKQRLEDQLKGGVSSEIINNTKEVVSILDNLNMLREAGSV